MHQPVTNTGGDQSLRFRMGSIKKLLTSPIFIKNLLTILKILAGLALLILSIQGIHWQSLVIGIRSVNLSWLILAIASVVLGLLLKFWRWVIFVKNYHIHASVARLYSAYFVGQAANIILPFRAGELVRVGYFANDPKLLPDIVTTIAIEKYLDLMALTLCGILLSYKISLDNFLNLRGLLLPLTVIMTILLATFILFGLAVWEKIRTGNLLPIQITDWLDRWVQASQWLRNPKQIIPGIIITIFIWSVMWLTNLLVFKSLGIPLGIIAAGLVLILVYIGLIPALMPGNIGPFYFFARQAVMPFGILTDEALLFAVVLHAIVTLPPLLVGFTGLLIRSDRPSSS